MRKAPWWRNPRFRSMAVQVVFVLITIWAFYTIFSNTIDNLNQRGIVTSFSFLSQVAPFEIAFSPFLDYVLGTSTYLKVFFVGLLNTILVAVCGIAAATFFGFFMGVLRLSPNWIVARIAGVYIETVRNVPLLLQLFFWNFAVFLPGLPSARDSGSLFGLMFLNNRGLYFPSVVFANPWIEVLVFAALAIGIVLAFLYHRRARRIQNETGKRPQTFWVSLALIIGLPTMVLLLGASSIGYDIPQFGRFNFSGGLHVPLPLFVLWFSLVFYTSAFIAENVRGGINSVDRGQTEASLSLGFTRIHMLRLIIIPQAMRVIIPPTISQYLNLTKNSSLAIAVSYEEIVSLWAGISLNQTGQALLIIGTTVLVYEALSLLTSAVLNFYNKRVQLVER